MLQKLAVIVHDEPVWRDKLASMLRRLGFDVATAIDGPSTMRQIAQRRPDVLCVSLRLPRESGYELCELIRRDRSLDHVQVVVIGDRHSPDIVAYAEEAGANAFLARPFDLRRLAHCLGGMVESRPEQRPSSLSLAPSVGLAAE